MQPKPAIPVVASRSTREEEILRAVDEVRWGSGYGQVVVTIKASRITVVNKTETLLMDGAYD